MSTQTDSYNSTKPNLRKATASISKTDEASRRLADFVRRLTPHAKLPRVAELRRELGVSLTTLDAALHKLEERQLIYRVQGSGIFVSPRASAGIALICDPSYFRGATHSPFWDILREEAQARAQAHNEQFSCHFTQPPEDYELPIHEGLARQILDGRIQGVLGVGIPKGAAEWLQKHQVPFVAFAGEGNPVVCLDESELVRIGTRELIHNGCRRIEYWTTTPQWIDVWLEHTNHKVQIFQEAAQAHGLTLEDIQVRDSRHLLQPIPGTEMHVQTVESFQEQGYRIASEVFCKGNRWPDGVLIDDDLMTYGALMALRKCGVTPGKDVQMISHANRGSTVLMGHDDLTQIEFDPAEVVACMFDLLEAQIDGQKPQEPCTFIAPHFKPALSKPIS
jgi:DNA-binding LacI/PurR family transcriptional regulator